MVSQTEENYLKAIYKISEKAGKAASTNAISAEMKTSAASVSDMLKRLSEKQLLHYEKYRGVELSPQGLKIATGLIRKHRLWEVFLVDKLHFTWDEVHEIAEQLEHIQSTELVSRLDRYLGNPQFDPHGDPIPDEDGNFVSRNQVVLGDLKAGASGVVVGVQEHSSEFLQHLDHLQLQLGAVVEIKEKFGYDESVKLIVNNSTEVVVSQKVAQNIFLTQT